MGVGAHVELGHSDQQRRAEAHQGVGAQPRRPAVVAALEADRAARNERRDRARHDVPFAHCASAGVIAVEYTR